MPSKNDVPKGQEPVDSGSGGFASESARAPSQRSSAWPKIHERMTWADLGEDEVRERGTWADRGEDGCEVPGPLSNLDKAFSLAYQESEGDDTEYAIILECVEPRNRTPYYRAVLGKSRIITLSVPQGDDASDVDRALETLERGALVHVRERVEYSYKTSQSSWVVVSRADKCPEEQLPRTRAKVLCADTNSEMASVLGLDDPMPIVPAAPGEGVLELKKGIYFLCTPTAGGSGDLQILWENAVLEEKNGDGGVPVGPYSSDDLAEKFHYAGSAVLNYVRDNFGVVGDLTVSEKLTNLPFKGGKTFLKGLEMEREEGYAWGEMVMAAAYKETMDDVQDPSGRGRSVEAGSGKSNAELSQEERKERRESQAQAEQRLTRWRARARKFVQEKMRATEGALFFNPTPGHLDTFLEWLGKQMRFGYQKGLRRRAVVAVDVMEGSNPRNLQNIQTHPLWKAGVGWKPRSYTILEDRVLHMEHDPERMDLAPVLERRGKKVLLVEFDSLYVANMRPRPVAARLGDQQGVYMGPNPRRLPVGPNGPKGRLDFTYVVTVPRSHRWRGWLQDRLTRKLPSAHPKDYEKWEVSFADAAEGQKWLDENRTGAYEQLFTCPRKEFEGGLDVINLQTKVFIEPKNLYYWLQARWVELVGCQGGSYEYRLSTPGRLKDTGRYLYDLNRMRTMNKRKGGRLLNTFMRISSDGGIAMRLEAQAGPRILPSVERIRYHNEVKQGVPNRSCGTWFSINGGPARREGLEEVIRHLELNPVSWGTQWDEHGVVIWVCLNSPQEVEKLRLDVLVDGIGGETLIIRRRDRPPSDIVTTQMGQLRRSFCTPDDDKDFEPEERRFSPQTMKMVKQFCKTSGFRRQAKHVELIERQGPSSRRHGPLTENQWKNQAGSRPDAGRPSKGDRPDEDWKCECGMVNDTTDLQCLRCTRHRFGGLEPGDKKSDPDPEDGWVKVSVAQSRKALRKARRALHMATKVRKAKTNPKHAKPSAAGSGGGGVVGW